MELQLSHITKQYGKLTALSDVSLTLENGVYALLGPNGAGKTTLIGIITNLISPTSGAVTYGGEPITRHLTEYTAKIGYLPQDPQFYRNFRGDEFLRYMAVMKGIGRRRAADLAAELLEKVNLTQDAHRYIGTYSGGMRQRLGIAQALLNDPEILILDEPTAGLDPKERIRFRNLISQLAGKRIVLLATHIVSDVESAAKEVILLKSGRLLQMTPPDALLAQIEGKVWSTVCAPEDLETHMKRLCISSAAPAGGGYRLRIVSDERPLPDAQDIAPNLEDAYLYYFGEAT